MLWLKPYAAWQIAVISVSGICWVLLALLRRPRRRDRVRIGGVAAALAVAGTVAWWIASVDPLVRWITAWLAALAATTALLAIATGFLIGIAVECGRWAHRTARHALRRRPRGSDRAVRLVPTTFPDVDGVARPALMPVDLAAELHRRAAPPPP